MSEAEPLPHPPFLSHLDARNRPTMVDVGEKAVTHRTAVAEARVVLPAALAALLDGDEIVGKKGPVLQTARLAGIMAAKRTGELIPLCHPLALENIAVEFVVGAPDPAGAVEIVVRCRVALHGKTGVEMEALTGASIAVLTIYDMGKAVSHDIVIRETRLVAKSGGKRDFGGAPARG